MNLSINGLLANPLAAGGIGAAAGYYVGKHNTTWAVVGGLLGIMLARAMQTKALTLSTSARNLIGSSALPSSNALPQTATSAPAAPTSAGVNVLTTLGQPVEGFGGYSISSPATRIAEAAASYEDPNAGWEGPQNPWSPSEQR